MKDLHMLWWKAFWTWFSAVAIYFNLTVLPVMVWCIAHYTDHNISWFIGFSTKVVAASILIASSVGYYMARHAQIKGRRQNMSVKIERFYDVIEVGQKWRFYSNLPGLLYTLCRKFFIFAVALLIAVRIPKPKQPAAQK